MAPPPVGQGSKEPARGGVLGVSSATSFFLEFPLVGDVTGERIAEILGEELMWRLLRRLRRVITIPLK